MMRGIFALSGAAAALAACPADLHKAPPSGQWVMTFEDDFEGDALDLTSWTPSDYNLQTSQYDGHNALFIADRVAVSNGTLQITTAYDPRTLNGVKFNFTSGWIDSQGKRLGNLTTPTRWEASIKMPSANSSGSWPAWWLLPNNTCWPVGTEVDIVEWYAGLGHFQRNKPGNPTSASSSYHYGYSCSDDKYDYNTDTAWFPNMSNLESPIVDFTSGFHVFGVEINATGLRFYVDGDTKLNIAGNTSFIRELVPLCMTDPDFVWGHSAYLPWGPMYGILNVAMSPDAAFDPWWLTHNATTLVDWVRWFEFQADAAAVDASGDAPVPGDAEAA